MALATKQIHDLMSKYEELLKSEYPDLLPIRHESPVGGEQRFQHLLFMCQQIKEFCLEMKHIPHIQDAKSVVEIHNGIQQVQISRREKTMRWLGWLQAKLHSEGLLSMEQAKRDLMPPGAEFSVTGG